MKGNKILQITKNRIKSTTENIFLLLHKCVNFSIEKCMEFWLPHLKNKPLELKNIQEKVK